MNAKTFIPSPQQSDVFEFVAHGRGSAFVEAVAGAGKTTTLVEACKLMNGSVAFAAYNKKIADEIREKVSKLGMGNRVRVGTFHSFGFNAWRRAYPQVQAGPEAANTKSDMIRDFLLGRHGGDVLADARVSKLYPMVAKLVSLAKQRAIGIHGIITDESLWYDIVDHFDLAYELEDERDVEFAITMAMDALQQSIHLAPEIIDFDDMIFMPIYSGIRMWENDWLIVDEAQDTNPARRALARKMLRRNGRSIWVGDRHQAIYGFTGADNDAVDLIIKGFSCQSFPLTVTYRCPKAVVAEANKVVSHIHAHESAPEGAVTSIDTYDNALKTNLRADDAILCRNTRPLVEMAFQLIRRRVPCHVEGRDIGAGLLKLVNRWQVSDLGALRDHLAKFLERETGKLIAKGKEQQAEALTDRVETIYALADNAQSVDELRTSIATMFQDSDGQARPTLTLSTVHKSKGREWERVFILGRDELMPSPYARQDWQQAQEMNLIYVAVTRAKDHLVFVPLPPPVAKK